jgi:potassium-transporting ATPase potassium-binding subunit
MTGNELLQVSLYVVVVLGLAWPLGLYMARVYEGRSIGVDVVLGPVERFIYRASGVVPGEEMGWTTYAIAMLAFNLAGMLLLYALQRLQGVLPLNPQNLGAIAPDLAFNNAAGFVTTTDWQSYAGETTMSYFTQAVGLTVQNFLAAATGLAIMAAFIRGFARRGAAAIGNFWVDLTRVTLYILLPLSVGLALLLVSQGVVQTFGPYAKANVAQPTSYDEPITDKDGQPARDEKGSPQTRKSTLTEQVIAVGPAASQVAIKQLGTNGGGFFNANSAHPFENPTPVSNFVEMLALLLIPAALCHTFGRMVRDARQGWAVLAAMTLMFVALLLVCVTAEQQGRMPSAIQAGANMEGKEVRFGVANSALWAAATTASGNGSVNAMLDSFTPIGGLVALWLIQLGEVVFGGVGSGLYGMLVYVIVAVFVAGLMVGRMPEYLGKKIEIYEVKMASLAILLAPALVLIATAVGVLTRAGRAGMGNPGAHGFTEVLYAFSSATNNNGSILAGLNTNTPFYNTALGLVILFGRFWVAVPVLAIAGSLAGKRATPIGPGTLPTHTPVFIGLLVGVVILLGALTYLPALALGPIVEHLMLIGAR